jgi:hypothetical protein
MLTALRDALGDFTNMTMTSLMAILVNPDQMKLFPFYVYPAYVWGHLNSAATLASQDPAQVYRGAETLQSLLATILYFWCDDPGQNLYSSLTRLLANLVSTLALSKQQTLPRQPQVMIHPKLPWPNSPKA